MTGRDGWLPIGAFARITGVTASALRFTRPDLPVVVRSAGDDGLTLLAMPVPPGAADLPGGTP